jgi:hypothetical protein
MSQISIRLAKQEYELVIAWAKERGLSIASAYKAITSKAFEEWKENFILLQYSSGKIRLKEAWYRSELSLMAFMKLLDLHDIEPPHTELIELKSSEKRQLLTTEILFKEGKKLQRQTPELDFKDKYF